MRHRATASYNGLWYLLGSPWNNFFIQPLIHPTTHPPPALVCSFWFEHCCPLNLFCFPPESIICIDRLIPCCVLSKLTVIQLNIPCTLLVILSRLTQCYIVLHLRNPKILTILTIITLTINNMPTNSRIEWWRENPYKDRNTLKTNIIS